MKSVEAKQESLIPMNGEARAEIVPAQSETTSILRLAIEKGASIETIERLMAMMKEERAYRVESEFNEALSQAQTEMQCVAPDKTNSQTGSDFASYAALDKMVRPIYTKHGFSLSF